MDMEDLERRFNGPIPQRLKDIVIHGAALKADIAELENLVACYTEQVKFHKRSASCWRANAGEDDGMGLQRLEMATNNDHSAVEAQAVLSKLTAQLTDMKGKV